MATTPLTKPRLLIVAGILLVVLIAAGAWFMFQRDSPPNAFTVLGQQLPPDAKVVGTSRFTSGMSGRDGVERAVVEIGEHQFEQFRKDAGYEPSSANVTGMFTQDYAPDWWDVSNFPETRLYVMDRKEKDGTTSTHYLKYERGRAYAVRSFYGPK